MQYFIELVESLFIRANTVEVTEFVNAVVTVSSRTGV